MAKENEKKVSPGRIVTATVAQGGKAVKRPALVVAPVGESSVRAMVFPDFEKSGDFHCLQGLVLDYDAKGEKLNSWAWPSVEKSEPKDS